MVVCNKQLDFQVLSNAPSHVPTGIVACPEELFVQPESFLSGKFKNIMSYNDLETCGHFVVRFCHRYLWILLISLRPSLMCNIFK